MTNPPQEVGNNPTALYRLYDNKGALLRVGITHSPQRRFAQYARQEHWWPQVARKTVAWCGTREAALSAEAVAIRQECPRYNVIGMAAVPSPPQFTDPHKRNRAKNAERQREWRARQAARQQELEDLREGYRQLAATVGDLKAQLEEARSAPLATCCEDCGTDLACPTCHGPGFAIAPDHRNRYRNPAARYTISGEGGRSA